MQRKLKGRNRGTGEFRSVCGRWAGSNHARRSSQRVSAERARFADAPASHGWAAELIVLPDGRRQVTGLFLPGERLISSPLAGGSEAASLLAITQLELHFEDERAIASEFDLLRSEVASYLSHGFRSLVRLGCLTAYEKTANLLLEIAERAGALPGEDIEFPLTQELIADMLGLSQVHVNRTLQQLRRDGLIELQGGRLSILQPQALRTAGQYRTLFLPKRDASNSAAG